MASPSQFADVCRFVTAASGTGNWQFSSTVTGYQSPTTAGLSSGVQYSYRAESTDLTQWEVGFGTYTASNSGLTRGTVLFNSAAGSSAINFSLAPQVAIVALAEDLGSGQWTAFTPAVTITGGGGNGTMRWKQVGKSVNIQVTITCTTAGNFTSATLPATPQGNNVHYYIAGREIVRTGVAWTGNCVSNPSANFLAQNYLNVPAMSANDIIEFAGVFEASS